MVQFKKPITSNSSATETTAVLCTVQSVDTNLLVAEVIDQTGTYRKVSIRAVLGKPTAYPLAGERWIISREYGDWMFIASVGVTPSGGSQGAQGPQGSVGPQGAQGSQGSQGAQGPIFPQPYTAPSTYWQAPSNQMGVGTAVAAVSGNCSFLPFDVGPLTQSFTDIGVGVSVAQVGGTTTIYLGVYNDDGTGGRPATAGGPIGSTSAATLTSTGTRSAPLSLTLSPGRYWVSFLYLASVAPSTVPSIYAIGNSIQGPLPATDTIGNVTSRGWFLTGLSALPTTDVRSSMARISSTSLGSALVCLKAA